MEDVTVTGINYVAGIAYFPSYTTVQDNVLKDAYISGSGSNIAGLYVQGYGFTNLSLIDSIIEATSANSQFTGGAFAYNYRNANNIEIIKKPSIIER